jgi:hypothetical protein
LRDYGTVASQFWVRGTGKELRGDTAAQVVALYLMTSPHANMIGVYHLPTMYLAHETGLTEEGAMKALQRLSEKDFCTYEDEWVCVHNFAANQVGETLKPEDKRVKGVINELAKVPSGRCREAFVSRYQAPYSLPTSPSEAPSKPLRSQKQNRSETEPEPLPGFERFWEVWPKSVRKEARGKCLEVWRKAGAESHVDVIVAHVERLKGTTGWRKDGGQFIPAPLVYLNNRRWEGAEDAANDDDPYGLRNAL